jgi:hypothetical protein
MAMNGWPVVKWPNVCDEEMGVDPATIELVEKHWGAPPGVKMVAIAPDEIASLRLLFDLIEDGDWSIETYGGGFDGGNQTEPAECCAKLPNGEMIAWDQQSSRRYRASELAALVAAVNFTRKMVAE